MSWEDHLSSLPKTRGQRAEVLQTSEFRRIRDAPRRVWQDSPAVKSGELVRVWTEYLRKPGGTETLRPIQAAALQELVNQGGVFTTARTGAGKTLMSLLAAEAVNASRPLLLTPAALDGPTRRALQAHAPHWKIRPLRLLSYEGLGRVAQHGALIAFQPDLLILDEAFFVKNTGAGVTRVIGDYVKRRRKAGEPLAVVVMSGSPTSRTLRDYWHQLRWCFGDNMPLPIVVDELQKWMWALDEKVGDGLRYNPGALLGLSPEAPTDGELGGDLYTARARYGRRLMTWPGVVGSGSDLPRNGLVCSIQKLQTSPVVAKAVAEMRATWQTPCGLPFETAMDLWRHERELSCGLYYRWTKRPPFEWITARKAWSKFVRDQLSRSRTMFTPLAVSQAIAHGKLDDGRLLAAWQAVEPTFEPETEAIWICDQTLNAAAEWLVREGGIAWVHHGAFGRRLSQVSGVPYFAAEGRAPNGAQIDMHDGPAIASLSSCSRGFNLQGTASTRAKHWKNLIVTSPTKNLLMEQTISRTHRDGQERDDVFALFLQTLEGDSRALDQARADASYVESTTLQPQRLGIAKWAA